MKEHNYFVRTKDKIYQCIDDFIILKDQGLYIKHFQDHIVKIADTIKELCDEFVVLKPDKKFLLANNNFDYIKTIWRGNENAEKSDYIYGAIWTDKGLIYVAKMNDKGELELL